MEASEKTKLRVKLVSAKNLRAADWAFSGGSSDPFCTCQVLGKPESRVNTRHVKKTLAPTWDEVHVIEDYQRGDNLEFAVLDFDKGSSSDTLGNAVLMASSFNETGTFSGDLPLENSGKSRSSLRVEVEIFTPGPDPPKVSKVGSRLKINIKEAKGLRPADWALTGAGKSDPYCEVSFAGAQTDGVIFSTKYCDKTLDPQWNEEFEANDYERGASLEFRVLDYDKAGSPDLLGVVVLDPGKFDKFGGFSDELRLKECGLGFAPTLSVSVEVLPPQFPDAPPVSIEGSRLKVTVEGAKGLRPADMSLLGSSSSDPYCLVQVLGKPDMAFGTKHIQKSLDPLWNEEFIMDEYALGDDLQFTVMDHDKAGTDDLLGRITLRSRDFDREGGFAGELRLHGSGHGFVATLSVRVEVIEPLVPAAKPVSAPGSRIKIRVYGARGLPAADVGILKAAVSDPFCSCEIKGKPELPKIFETKVVEKTLDPIWEETHEMLEYQRGDDLLFKVWDWDRGSENDLLGTVPLPARIFDRAGGWDGEVRLRQCGRGVNAILMVQVEILPPLPHAEPISEPGGRLQVTIVSATDLRPADWRPDGQSRSDPFCICSVKGKPESRFETKHIKKTLEPEWNEQHTIDAYDAGDAIEFKVYDRDGVKTSDLLGHIELPARDFDREGGFEGSLPLRECGRGYHSYLNVKIEVLPPFLPDAPHVSVHGSRLHVILHGAISVKPGGGHRCDVYCEVDVAGRQDAKISTRRIGRSVQPIWDEEHEVPNYNQGEDLNFKIYGQMTGRRPELLGRATLEGRCFDRDGGFDGELWMRDCGRGNRARLLATVHVLPPLEYTGSSTIKVSGLKVRGLGADEFGLANGRRAQELGFKHGKGPSSTPFDTYLTCEIVGRVATRITTDKVRNTSEPLFADDIELINCAPEDMLGFKLYACIGGSPVDLLGIATLKAELCEKEGGFSGDLTVIGKEGKPCAARLAVAVNMTSSGETQLVEGPAIAWPGSKLRVTIVSAAGRLASGEDLEFYCKCFSESRPDEGFETKRAARSGPAVMWNDEHEIPRYDGGEPLELAVLSRSKLTAEENILGTLTMDARYFDKEGGFDGQLLMKHPSQFKKGCHAMLAVKVQVVMPQPPEPASVAELGSRLRVTVLSARGLRPATTGAVCEVSVAGRPTARFMTADAEVGSSEPSWAEADELEDYGEGEGLEFRVLAQPSEEIGESDILGRAKLDGLWFDRAGGWEGELRLVDTGEHSPSAFLRVRVEVLGPLLPDSPPLAVPGSRLRITMTGASGLAVAGQDLMTPDPVGVCQIAGKPYSRVMSEIIKNTTTPQWNEEFELTDYDRGEDLEFQVYDGDRGLDSDLLGTALLPGKYFDHDVGYVGSLRLSPRSKDRVPRVMVKVEVLPPLRPNTPPVSEPGCTLSIKILSASNLKACAGKPDPFVVAMLRGKPDSRFRTKVVIASSQPIWDSEHYVSGYEPGDHLDFRVMDNDVGLEADILGRVALLSRDFDRAAGYDGELSLRGCRAGVSTLDVSIRVLPPDRTPLTVNIQKATNLRGAIGPDPLIATVVAQYCGRNRGQGTRTNGAKGDETQPSWNEVLHLDKYVQGDDLLFEVACGDFGPSLGQARVKASDVLKSGGERCFSGELKLEDANGRATGSLFAQVEYKFSYEERVKQERNRRIEAERAQRAQEQADAKVRKQEVEAAEKAELEKRAHEEMERRAAYEARLQAEFEAAAAEEEARQRRLEAEAKPVSITVLLIPSLEVLCEVSVPGGSYVPDLARAVAKEAHIAMAPRILEGSALGAPEYRKTAMLIDLGLQNGSEVFAEICPTVLTASKDRTARLWNAATGECEMVMRGHKEAVRSIDATGDLKWCLTASDDGTAKVWVVDWKAKAIMPAWTLKGHTAAVHFACFSPNTRLIVTCSEDRTAKLWRMRTGECLQTLDGHQDTVVSASFSPDSEQVTTIGRDRNARVWEADTGRCIARLQNHENGNARVASSDGKQFILNSEGSRVSICGVQTGELQHVLVGHSDEVLWAAFAATKLPRTLQGGLGGLAGMAGSKSRLPGMSARAPSMKEAGSLANSRSEPFLPRMARTGSKSKFVEGIRKGTALAGSKSARKVSPPRGHGGKKMGVGATAYLSPQKSHRRHASPNSTMRHRF